MYVSSKQIWLPCISLKVSDDCRGISRNIHPLEHWAALYKPNEENSSDVIGEGDHFSLLTGLMTGAKLRRNWVSDPGLDACWLCMFLSFLVFDESDTRSASGCSLAVGMVMWTDVYTRGP